MGWSGLCRLFLRWRTVDGLWSLFLSLYLYMASEDQAQVLGLVQQRLRPANHFSCPISKLSEERDGGCIPGIPAGRTGLEAPG
uniref:D930048N14Rik protein n=1 Tax=Mus musculus TaxID=10090 RepID=Q501P8_MOUSE|nr:D930048N14Rik protein [Mus musculus]